MSKSLAEHLAEVRRAIPTGTGKTQANATKPVDEQVDLSEYRPISAHERSILTSLLQSSGPEATAFLPQLEGMMVQSSCTCGCPTISLAVAEHHARTPFRRNIVADMLGEASDGTVGLLVFQARGKLTCLEVYDLAGREGPFGLPNADTIYPFTTSRDEPTKSGASEPVLSESRADTQS